MGIVDSHIHLFQRPYTALWPNTHIKTGPEGELAMYEAYQAAFGIGAAFVVGYEGEPWAGNNDYILALSRQRDWILPFGFVPIDSERAPQVAQSLAQRGFFGLSCYTFPHDAMPEWLDAPSMDPLWGLIEERDMPISINIGADQCAVLDRALSRHPGCTAVISHMARPRLLQDGSLDEGSYRPLLDLARFERVYVKLSGFYAFVPQGWRYPQTSLFVAVDRLREVFGTDRLVMGTDCAPVLEHCSFAQSLELLRSEYRGFSADEMEAVYGGNARQIIARRRQARG